MDAITLDTEKLQQIIDEFAAAAENGYDENCENQTRKIFLKKSDYETVISTPGAHCKILCPLKLREEKHVFFHSTSGNKYLLWWSENRFTRIYNDVGEIMVIDTEWILSQQKYRLLYGFGI